MSFRIYTHKTHKQTKNLLFLDFTENSLKIIQNSEEKDQGSWCRYKGFFVEYERRKNSIKDLFNGLSLLVKPKATVIGNYWKEIYI